MPKSKSFFVSVDFRVPCFSSVHILLLELSCGRMLKLHRNQRNQDLIMHLYPRKGMEVMDLVMLTKNLKPLNMQSLASWILLLSPKLSEFLCLDQAQCTLLYPILSCVEEVRSLGESEPLRTWMAVQVKNSLDDFVRRSLNPCEWPLLICAFLASPDQFQQCWWNQISLAYPCKLEGEFK